jgi:hypothetical protein
MFQLVPHHMAQQDAKIEYIDERCAGTAVQSFVVVSVLLRVVTGGLVAYVTTQRGGVLFQNVHWLITNLEF